MKNLKYVVAPLTIIFIVIAVVAMLRLYKPNTNVTTSQTQVRSNRDNNLFRNATSSSTANTETAPPGPAPYLNVDNISEQTGLTVIISPKYGDSFTLGDDITVKWNPELIDVSFARLVALDGPQTNSVQIYRSDNLGDTMSRDGVFDYVLPKDLSVYPGRYQIKLIGNAGQYTYTSDIFTISSPVSLLKREDKPFGIKTIFGAKDTYKVGEIMKLNIETFNGDGSPADPSKGFSVQATLYSIDNRGVASANATYDPNVETWHLDIPVATDTYRVEVSLYCGSSAPYPICAQEYDQAQQVNQYVNFQVIP